MREMELEIFRAGQYGKKGEWTEEALDGIARDYDTAMHEAPVTLDHAQSGPALGWVESVMRVGDRLVAKLRDLNPAFTEMLRDGAFKKRSIELYPEAAHSGRPYLKAVSFLGAAAPAVKGLRDVLLSDSTGAVHFEQTPERALQIDFDEAQDVEGFESVEADGNREASAPETQVNCSKGELPEVSEIADAPQATEFESELDFTEFREGLVQRGAWLPSWEVQGIEDFVRALGQTNLQDSEAVGSAGLLGWFEEFLTNLPRFLPLGESAAASPAPVVSKRFEEGLIDDADNIDPESLALHRRASLLMDTEPGLCYAEALRLTSKP